MLFTKQNRNTNILGHDDSLTSSFDRRSLISSVLAASKCSSLSEVRNKQQSSNNQKPHIKLFFMCSPFSKKIAVTYVIHGTQGFAWWTHKLNSVPVAHVSCWGECWHFPQLRAIAGHLQWDLYRLKYIISGV